MRRFSDAGTHDANHALRRPASEKRQGRRPNANPQLGVEIVALNTEVAA